MVRGGDLEPDEFMSERFRFAFDHAVIAMAVMRLDCSIMRANPAFCRLMERTEDDLIGRTLDAISHPKDAGDEDEALRMLLGGHSETYENVRRFVLPDSRMIWGRLALRVVSDGGVPMAIFGQVMDVTELKQTGQSLTESQSRIRLLASNARDFLVFRLRFAPALQVEEMSPAVEALTGYKPEEFYADPTLLFSIVHQDDRQKLQDAIASAAPQAEPLVLRWRHRDGRTTWSMGRAVPILDDSGSPVGVEGIAYDITAQQESEEARAAEEHRFRSLVQNTNDLISILGADGTVRYVTPSVKQLLGFDPDEFVGKTAREFVHPDDIEHVATALAAGMKASGRSASSQFRILHRDGTYRWVEATVTDALNEDAIQGVIVNARDVTERKVAEEQLMHQAVHDRLTDLPNRALLMDRLQRALGRLARGDGIVAVLALNLDRFKIVNENLGHEAGDELLIEITGRLAGRLRPADTLARLGGDDFVLAIEVAEEHEVLALTRAILEGFGEPIDLRGRELHVSASIGVVQTKDPAHSPEQLLRSADLAMRRAKAAGGSRMEIFDESMRVRASGRLEMEAALRRAIDQNELRVFYQPVVSLAGQSIVGAEALIRWDRPGIGLVSPAEFIPLAEETGFIVPMGFWIFEQACAQIRQWNERSDTRLSVAVNLSVRQFSEQNLLFDLQRIINDTGVDPSTVGLEITESVLIEDNDFALEALIALKALKIKLALDDFGTRYSSLSYLRRFPFDTVKVDQSFVRGMLEDDRDREIVRGVISLAHAVGLSVVAEGIETEEQLQAITAMGADRAQGYLLGRPLPPAAFEQLLSVS